MKCDPCYTLHQEISILKSSNSIEGNQEIRRTGGLNPLGPWEIDGITRLESSAILVRCPCSKALKEEHNGSSSPILSRLTPSLYALNSYWARKD